MKYVRPLGKGGVLSPFSLGGGRVEDRLKLPNANLAVVDRTKVVEYLLNREHPDNGGKADCFIGMGFNPVIGMRSRPPCGASL